MKKLVLILTLTIAINLLLPLFNAGATPYSDVVTAINNRASCNIGEYEVAMIKNDGTITKVDCYATYDLAEPVMNSQTSTITNVATIIKYISIATKEIVDAKYGMLNVDTKPDSNHNTNIYSSATATSSSNYFNGSYGTDAPLLDYDNNAQATKMKIAGYTGWLKKIDSDAHLSYSVIPISLVKAPTYYYVNDNNELVHKLSVNIADPSGISPWSIYLGPAPTYMKKNTNYYSFDGNYFYTDLVKMLDDYKNNSFVNALNEATPYYNYYQYLPYRTKTAYTSTDINEYLQNRGYTQKPLSYPCTSGNQSMLYAEGPNFIDSQEKFGANAALSFALSINESGWGRSLISVTKKNVFGHGAYDYDPVGSADSYSDVKYSIYYHADKYVSFGYADPADWRYNGSHFGNKASGMNVKYASDPYWSEKMASNYYQFDLALGMQDYKLYEVGLKTSTSAVNIRKEPNSTSSVIYQLKADVTDIPVVILGEVTGEDINGNTKWYKIQSDPLLDANRVAMEDPATIDNRPTYNWSNNYVYVHSSAIDIIGEETQYIEKSGSFYLDKLEWDNTNQVINFRGYLSVVGVNNTLNLPASYSLILKDVNDNTKEYIIPLDRWGNKNEYPFQIPSQGGYDYSGSWFNAKVSLKDIPEGDYIGYVRARINKAETTAILRNMFSKTISNKITDNEKRGYLLKTNYYIKDIPLEIFIRDDGLISNVASPTRDNMLNSYSIINFNNNLLNIRGTSFNIGGNYNIDQTVERKIIFENITTYERYEFASNYIDNGDYAIVLRVSDNLNKTRAWFDSNVDLPAIPEGRYAIYIKTKSGTVDDYGELNDIFNRTLNKQITLGNKIYSLELNRNKRSRLELVVTSTGISNDTTSMKWNNNGINIEGWAYSDKTNPSILADITHELVFTNTTDSTEQIYDLDSVTTCSINSINNCSYYHSLVGFKKNLDLTDIPNGRYLVNINTKVGITDTYKDKLLSSLDLADKLARTKIGNDEKLLTFSYEGTETYLTVEDFTYEYDIAIDVGHYGIDTGAINGTITEQELNFIVSSYEKQRYIEHGLTVWMNKNAYNDTPELIVDNGWSLLHRAAYSYGYQAVTSKIAYSNHHNYNGDFDVSGFEVICPASLDLTKLSTEKLIRDSWVTITNHSFLHEGFYTREYFEPYDFFPKYENEVYNNIRDYYAVIRIPIERFNTKSVIYEPAYMSNSNNFTWYYTNENWKKMSELKIKYYVESLGKVYDGKYDTL